MERTKDTNKNNLNGDQTLVMHALLSADQKGRRFEEMSLIFQH